MSQRGHRRPTRLGALAAMRRVLAPGGALVVLEHVRGWGRLATWQDRLAPLWSRLAAGCHPNRDTRGAIERAGFTFRHVEEFAPLPAWSSPGRCSKPSPPFHHP